MEEIGILVEKAQDEIPALSVSRPQTGLSFLGPEPEDLEDLYSRYKKLQQELEFLEVQEEYIKDEQKNLKKEFLHAQEEVKRIQSIPLVIGQFLEAVDQNTAIVGSTTGSNYYVRILSTIDRELLKPNASVALHKHSNALVDVLPPEADSSIMMLTSDQKPDVMYADIGGMDIQKQEVREAVELPLTHFELYKQIGIDPPRGVLMYGPPGCGKTMLAKAVAHHTTAAFIRVVGSEFVQKYLGEGPRMVRDVFRLAKENAPAIIFIDEIDAIATKRFDAQTGADREVQRILLELLNQMDGFDQNVNVKVIMATNRADTLDPALLRPGRLDRKIEFPLPDRRQKRLIFSTITSKMNLSEEVDLEDCILLCERGEGWRGTRIGSSSLPLPSPSPRLRSFLNSPTADVARPDKISGADINSICQESGMLAVRENRYIVLAKDFEKAYKTVIKKDEQEHEFYK
ncbi:26S proteasome regulatory subunit 6B isoform X1 [Pteropus medius]|uniref:26S proteasome regulatory subunit 6B isoform X1 n=1 Tax=Pteropus vampyrus TaxID=132908 RepID=UPI00196B419A|nr:26S proteasome regulatory subunit 6B isoform X1 [Pteropus giganteus]